MIHVFPTEEEDHVRCFAVKEKTAPTFAAVRPENFWLQTNTLAIYRTAMAAVQIIAAVMVFAWVIYAAADLVGWVHRVRNPLATITLAALITANAYNQTSVSAFQDGEDQLVLWISAQCTAPVTHARKLSDADGVILLSDASLVVEGVHLIQTQFVSPIYITTVKLLSAMAMTHLPLPVLITFCS